MNVGFVIFELQEQHLGHDQIGAGVVDHSLQEDDAILEQAAVNIKDPLFAAAAFHHIGYQGHGKVLQAHPAAII